MKFVDLAMGQQFEIDGETFVRSGPMVATHTESGKQRFMARYMVVKTEAAAPVEVTRPPEMLSSETVTHALETFHNHCQSMLEQLSADLPPERMNSLSAQLDQARDAFLRKLADQ